MNKILTPTVRRWLYGIAIAFVPVAAFYGWLKPEAVPIVLPLVMAIFNVSGGASENPPLKPSPLADEWDALHEDGR